MDEQNEHRHGHEERKPHGGQFSKTVHYVIKEQDLPPGHAHKAGKERPAIVTEDYGNSSQEEGAANLTVFASPGADGVPNGVLPVVGARYSTDKEAGTWHWPQD